MRRISVFCGSSTGARPEYLDAARQLGALLARYQIGLVYGGGKVAIMGVVARAARENGGEVIGVIPEFYFELYQPPTLDKAQWTLDMTEGNL
ncbi:MAG: hypothetical protein R3335_02300 [Anaerolineales bacterium]|nr:hypothetical protein [Anaerolineales bacterium]